MTKIDTNACTIFTHIKINNSTYIMIQLGASRLREVVLLPLSELVSLEREGPLK